MLWVGPKDNAPMTYILTSAGMNWKWQAFPDTYQEGEPVDGSKSPPSGLVAPVRGFGKVWWNNPSIQNELGWAVAPEQGDTASTVTYGDGGWMGHMLGPNRVFVLQSGGFGSDEQP